MKYTPILLKDGSAYLVGTPEYASEPPMDLRDKILLELNDKINQLETDKMEDYKAIWAIDYQSSRCGECGAYDTEDGSKKHKPDCIVNKAVNYIKENS